MKDLCLLQTAFILPTIYPVSYDNLNWTCVTVGAVIIGVMIAWFLPKFGARHWYHGKSHTLECRPEAVSANCFPLPPSMP